MLVIIYLDDVSIYSNKKKKAKKDAKYKIVLQHNALLDDPSSHGEEDDDWFSEKNTDILFSKHHDQLSIEDDTFIEPRLEKFLTNDNTENKGKNFISVKKKKITLDTPKLFSDRTEVENSNFNSSLLSVDVLPNQFQDVFKFKKFNKMQSISFDSLYNSNENCIISSPTGSGKTVLFELAILNLLKNADQGNINNVKVIYIAPTKSLCQEIYKKWKDQLSFLTVGMLTSDTSFLDTEKVKKSSIIITTPEKWDLLTRKWHDYIRLFELVRLILVDEIHTLGESRGATLEVILTRMKTMCENIRVIAASATIPNIEDIALWLKTNNSVPAKVLKFDDTFRQVQLKKLVYGYQFYNNNNEFQKDAFYNNKLCDIILENGKQKPVLIFCSTRSSTVSTAKYLSKNLPKRCRSNKSISLHDSSLKECYTNGIGFHNAGLSFEDRTTIEREFIDGNVSILCSTSTLAMGVNLPAYLVIIKGTSIWNNSDYTEYSNLDILQMMGRAGRPQFEKEGCAVIMTENTKKKQFELLINGKDILESTLHLNLIEHLCSEISLNTIANDLDAVKWLQHTFFYVRFIKNPKGYWQLKKYLDFDKNPDTQLVNFSKSLLENLQKENVVEDDNAILKCTSYGKAMVRHYITFETIKKLISCPRMLSLNNTLDLLTKCKEFDQLRLRRNEKRLFKEINLFPLLRFPFLTEKRQSQIIDQTSQKVSLLIQHELGGLEFPCFDWAHKLHNVVVQDKLKIFRHSQRLLKCMIDTFIEKEDGISLNNAIFILRSINGKAWSDTPIILRQLKSIGLISVRKLVNQGITNFDKMLKLNEGQIEYYLSLKPGGAKIISNDLRTLPTLAINAKVENCLYSEGNIVQATLKVEISAEFSCVSWHGSFLSIDTEIFNSDGSLIDFRRVKLKHLKTPKCFKALANFTSKSTEIELIISCQELSGIEKKVVLKSSDLPRKWRNELEKARETTTLDNCLFVNDSSSSQNSSSGTLHKDLKSSALVENKNDSDHDPSDSLASDDSLMRDLNEANTNLKVTNHAMTNSNLNRTIRLDGNYECLHLCKDKKNCRHLCCKEGIPISSMRSSSTTTRKVHNKKDSIENITSHENANFKPTKSSRPKLNNYIYDASQARARYIPNNDKNSNVSQNVYMEEYKTMVPKSEPTTSVVFANNETSPKKYAKRILSINKNKTSNTIDALAMKYDSNNMPNQKNRSELQRYTNEDVPTIEEIKITLSSDGLDMSQHPSQFTSLSTPQKQPRELNQNISSILITSSSSILESNDDNTLDFLGSDVEVG